jgi:hypothetical protein
MDITSYAQSLEEKLKVILGTGPEDLVTLGKALTEIRGVIAELKAFTVSYRFESPEEEIQFFKQVKPVFLSQYYFHKRKFEILLFDAFRDEKSRLENYQRILRKLERFARKNRAFYQYCLSGSTDLDPHYFSRDRSDYKSVSKDEKFSTLYESKLAKLLSADLTRDFIRRCIEGVNRGHSSDRPGLEWTSPKIALIETIYALYAGGVFNYGKADLKQIVGVFERTFSIDLGNYARAFSEIKIRKSGQANFLDYLRERLLAVASQ